MAPPPPPVVKSRFISSPPKSEWTSACVPIDELLRRYERAINQRFLARSACFHLVYLIILIALAAQFAQPLTGYLSNTGYLRPLTMDHPIRIPQVQKVFDITSIQLVSTPWLGPLIEGWQAMSFRDWQIMEMTRVAATTISRADPLSYEAFAYPTTVEQKRASYYSECGNEMTMEQYYFLREMGWNASANMQCSTPVMYAPCNDGPSTVDECIPDKIPLFVSSCSIPTTTSSSVNFSTNICGEQRGGGTVQMNCFYAPDSPWYTMVSPLVPNIAEKGGGTIGGSDPAWFSHMVTYGPFLDQSTTWVDNRTRITSTSDTVLNPGDQLIKSHISTAEQDMSGAITITHYSNTGYYYVFSLTAQSAGGASLYVFVAIIFFDLFSLAARLWYRPRTFLTLWVICDMIQTVFYIIFLHLIFEFFESYSTYPTPPLGQDGSPITCAPQSQIYELTSAMQIFGVLFAIAFLTVFKLTTFLSVTAMAWNTLVMSFRTLSWALILIAVAYLICGYASTLMFGPNAVLYSSLAYGFSAIGLMGFNVDVSVLYESMRASQPQASAAPTAFFIVMVYSVQLITSSVVSSIVAVTYLRVKAIRIAEDRFDHPAPVINNHGVATVIAPSSSHHGQGGGNGTVQKEHVGHHGHELKQTKGIVTTKQGVVGGGTDVIMEKSTAAAAATAPTTVTISWSRWCMTWIRWMARLAKETITGRYDYETVSPFVVLERLATWYRTENNREKTFITHAEIMEAIARIDKSTKLAYVSSYQAICIMETCGSMNVYTIDHARFLEKEWSDIIAGENGQKAWSKRTAENIARFCKRLAVVDTSEGELVDRGGYVSERESALNRSCKEAVQQFDTAEVSSVNLFNDLASEVTTLADEVEKFRKQLNDVVDMRRKRRTGTVIVNV